MTLSCQGDGTFERRPKRKRLGSSSRSATKVQKIEATVTQRPDLRAKFYSKVLVITIKSYMRLCIMTGVYPGSCLTSCLVLLCVRLEAMKFGVPAMACMGRAIDAGFRPR